MKINFTCQTCSNRFWKEVEAKYPGGGQFIDVELPQVVVFELAEDRVYRGTCDRGHSVCFVLPQQKFEILFDLGVCAIFDGYAREAVLSFAASLERYFEFSVRVILRKQGVEAEKITEMWKAISAQSERQLGSFIGLYTSEFKKKPNIMDQKHVTIRNNVAHKGAIPTKDEAIEFGDYIVSLIRPLTEEMLEHSRQAVRTVTHEHAHSVAPVGMQPTEYSVLTMGTILKAEPTEDTQSARPIAEQLADVHHRWSDWGKVK